MARYTEASCRLCRREKTKLYLKGDRCYTSKCALEKRAYPPGQHGQRRSKLSEYGIQLREKQKARRIYGVDEKKFRNYFNIAERQQGVTGENLLALLESRLDNVVYRLGFATSRKEARQLVGHGHFKVDGKRVDIPSYLVKKGEVIEIAADSKKSKKFKEIIESTEGRQGTIDWLTVDAEKMQGTVTSEPDIENLGIEIEEHLIVELYSK
jgi:small subunit ribosomal protein S4